MTLSKRLILASSSPRRRQLLSEAGFRFEVIAPRPEAEDDAPPQADPVSLVADLAYRKAADVVNRLEEHAHAWVLAADTVAECEGQVLGKPADEADARRILSALSGKAHRVLTGVCLWDSAIRNKPSAELVVETTLQMQPLSEQWLSEYLASGAWRGKAGAFGYQDDLGVVQIIKGTASNVVGLPMEDVREMLANRAGLPDPTGEP